MFLFINIVTCTPIARQRVGKQPAKSVSPLLGYATIDEAVLSMSSAPSNSTNGVLCDQLLVTQQFLQYNCVFCEVRAAAT
jgi:hypothetical protein